MRNPILSLAVGVAVLAYAGYHVWHGLYDAHEANASVHWPKAEGKVLSHSVTNHVSRHSTSSEPIVWYSYAVDGTEYKDSRIAWYTRTFPSETDANQFMNHHYPVGKAVPVYYDPNHPHHACLVRGGVTRAEVDVYAGLAMMAVSLVVMARVVLFPAR